MSSEIPRARCTFVPDVSIDFAREQAPELLKRGVITQEECDKVTGFCQGFAARSLGAKDVGKEIRDARRNMHSGPASASRSLDGRVASPAKAPVMITIPPAALFSFAPAFTPMQGPSPYPVRAEGGFSPIPGPAFFLPQSPSMEAQRGFAGQGYQPRPYPMPWPPRPQQHFPWPAPQPWPPRPQQHFPWPAPQPWPRPQQGHYPAPQAPAPKPAPTPAPAPVPTQPAAYSDPVIRIFDCQGGTDTKRAVSVDIKNPPEGLKQKVMNLVTTLTSLHKYIFEYFGRNSWDDKGSAYNNYVNFDKDMFNAFWNGKEMVYGSPTTQFGDGGKPADMTDISVAAHEMGHSLPSYKYEGPSGAWEEFKADWTFLILKHWMEKITNPAQADETKWMMGDPLIADSDKKECMRRADKPGFGSQYDVQQLALDNGKPHINAVRKNANNPNVRKDHGGVHIFSAIPSYVFYKTAMELNEPIYERQAKVLYATYSDPKANRTNASWQELANAWVAKARELGHNDIADSLTKSWAEVGVRVTQSQRSAPQPVVAYPFAPPMGFQPAPVHPANPFAYGMVRV